ncbi:MAG: toll/interleukin-1 receptor domain-containing protein [Verrucomicrobiales bacterium]|nr:toll/interleukin-1 receptor domain-containing protein [Verrucomicrobiales bacterium]
MPGPVPLSSDIEILLPGIRSEAPPEQFAGFSDIGDPTVTMVFPPYRYYAARTIAAVQAALNEGRMDSFAQAVEETRYAVQLRRNQGLDSMFLDINIDLCDAAQKSYVHHTDSSAIDRSVLRERFETIIAQCESRRAIYEIAEAKRLEWRANCWAGIAYATRGSERDYALKQVRHFVERTAKARCGRVSFFKTDGIYHLAHHTEHGDHVADWNAFVDNLMITCAGSQPQNEDRQKCSGVVFLSHNSKDKSFVAEVASSLKKRGIGVWLDQWDLRPGTNWVWELQRIIEECRSAAIFFGGNGLGKWQEKEISALIIEEVDRSLALVSVILPGATPDLKLPSFLRPSQNFDFREADRLKLKNNTDKLIGFLAPRSTV